MAKASTSPGQDIRRVVLQACAITSFAGMIWEIIAGNGLARVALLAVFVAYVLYELRHNVRTQPLMVAFATLYGSWALLDLWRGESTSPMDHGTTLSFLILAALVHAITDPRPSRRRILIFPFLVGFYTLGVALLLDGPSSQRFGFLILGGGIQVVVISIIRKVITTLAQKSEASDTHARIQTAVAACSQALLKRGSRAPLASALEALLDATEADYAYVDVNRTLPNGVVTWEIIAEAAANPYPEDDVAYVKGDYSLIEDVAARLATGTWAKIVTSELPSPVRERYEAEGIRAELIAPIMVGERWLGTVGYTDRVRDGGWTEIEIEGLMRAAEMVGAYWEREAGREGLLEMARAKDRFIATVSHELRTPMAAVIGFSSQLLESLDNLSNEEIVEMVELIHDQGRDVSHLLDDLLTSGRASTGNLTVTATDISLLEECESIVASTSISKEVEVGGENVLAHADGNRTRQIIRNLITNAGRYGGDHVEVRVSNLGSTACIEVKDDGSGVSSDEEAIFNPYVRGDLGKVSLESVGLGLSVARQLARLMKGELIYLREGNWTVFRLTLPLASHEERVAVTA